MSRLPLNPGLESHEAVPPLPVWEFGPGGALYSLWRFPDNFRRRRDPRHRTTRLQSRISSRESDHAVGGVCECKRFYPRGTDFRRRYCRAPNDWAVRFALPEHLQLGGGGMGTVYKVYDRDLNRVVALKVVRPELTINPEVMERFKQELLLARKISHKNILPIHDLGDHNGMKFISMAYVEGHDLSRTLKQQGPLAVDRAVHIARQLCAALDAAESEGVVHRDLKPQNILIDDRNVYVSDFGLAKSLESARI